MRQPNLSLTEKQELSAIMGNAVLMGALRKVMEEEAEFWHRLATVEAEKPNPNVYVLVRHAAREAGALAFEKVLGRAVGR